MKEKIIRVLSIGFILSLLVAFMPASSVMAAGDIGIDPDEGRIGGDIDIDGESFPPSDSEAEPPYYQYVDIYFTSETASVGDEIDTDISIYQMVVEGHEVDNNGDFSTSFEVPDELTDGSSDEDVRGGTYYVCVTEEGEVDIEAVAEFTVAAGEVIGFDPDEGAVGTEVEITGEEFGENEEITIEYDGDEIDIESGDEETDGSGDFELTFVVPESTAGNHTITINDETLTTAEESFTVIPTVSYSINQAPPGDTVEVSGMGFANIADFEIILDTVSVASSQTDSNGSFTVTFTVPDVDEGTYDLVVEDDDGNDVTSEFNVEIGIQAAISPLTSATAPGYVGQSVTISGVSFNPNTTIEIIYASDPTTVATTTSNAEGDFTATFSIPPSESGAHTITASDGTNTLQVPFYMEAEEPPVPQPLLPLMGEKAPAKPSFDWENVVDDSGLTYTLQIATAADFNSNSMVLDMVGLTQSEYTWADEQGLDSRSKDEPYYWRVRAEDQAGNVGEWTGNGEFHVGFTWPDWIVHLWWGLGALGGGLLGYVLGKRKANYY